MFALAFWLAAVSYSRDIAPLLAMRCQGCHAEAAGFRTGSYAELMAGGNLGKLVIPGDPDASLLVHFLDGRRGVQRRMPLGGRPLTAAELALVRRWIAEGAREDRMEVPVYKRSAEHVGLFPNGSIEVKAIVPEEGFVTVRVRDTEGKVWFERSGAVKEMPEEADFGTPREALQWEVRSGTGWPEEVAVELELRYARGSARGLSLEVQSKH